MSVRAVLTDIEGTTSSLSFVKEVLFPYARERMADFLAHHQAEPEVAAQIAAVRAEVGQTCSVAEVASTLVQWIDEDRKATPLKALQGLIWEAGYRKGDFKGHLYEDAWRNLRRWQEAGLRLYIFSSGSVHAQKLLFAHTEFGDLTSLFSGYYDTNIGAKREAAAYRAIAADVGLTPAEILFLSDIREELDAAREAGMQTTWLVRATTPAPDASHPQVSDFDAIQIG